MCNDMKNSFDNVYWHFDDAYNWYCERFYCQDNKETNNYIKARARYATTHMQMNEGLE